MGGSTCRDESSGVEPKRFVDDSLGVLEIADRSDVAVPTRCFEWAEHLVGFGAQPRPDTGFQRRAPQQPRERRCRRVIAGADESVDLVADLCIGEAAVGGDDFENVVWVPRGMGAAVGHLFVDDPVDAAPVAANLRSSREPAG